jgi:excisionase family DNA binding protein
MRDYRCHSSQMFRLGDTFKVSPHTIFGAGSRNTMKSNKKIKQQSHYLNKHQAAELLQISLRTLDNWMSQRLLPYVRIARTIRFRRSDLEESIGTRFERRFQ